MLGRPGGRIWQPVCTTPFVTLRTSAMQSQVDSKSLHRHEMALSTALRIDTNLAVPRPGPFARPRGAGLSRTSAQNRRLPVIPPSPQGQVLRIRPEIFDFDPALGLKLGQTKPKISGTVPTNRHTTIPNDTCPTSECFDEDPKLANCEIAQTSSC